MAAGTRASISSKEKSPTDKQEATRHKGLIGRGFEALRMAKVE
jgi:hypothetical protein